PEQRHSVRISWLILRAQTRRGQGGSVHRAGAVDETGRHHDSLSAGLSGCAQRPPRTGRGRRPATRCHGLFGTGDRRYARASGRYWTRSTGARFRTRSRKLITVAATRPSINSAEVEGSGALATNTIGSFGIQPPGLKSIVNGVPL